MTLAIEPAGQNSARGSAAKLGWLAIGVAAVIAGWFAASQLTLATPGPYARANVERAIPEPFPGFAPGHLTAAGSGYELAYRITYTIEEPPETASALLHSKLGWTASAASTREVVELLYRNERRQVGYIARFSIAQDGAGGSTVTAEFSPLPLRLAPTRGT